MLTTPVPTIISRWSSKNPADLFDIDNPATGEIIAHVQGSGVADVDKAVSAAHAAFSGHWRERSARERGALLIAAGKHLENYAQELAELVSRENGKPVRDALQFDVASLTGSFAFFGALAGKSGGEYLDLGFVTSATVREPFGVVAGIIPFNWPPIHTGAKVAPALAAGNTIVVKPGDQAPAHNHAHRGSSKRSAAGGRRSLRDRNRASGWAGPDAASAGAQDILHRCAFDGNGCSEDCGGAPRTRPV